MVIERNTQDNVDIISIKGSLDGSTANQAQDFILPLITNECKLVFDMNECDYISSAGLRVLLMTAKQLTGVGGKGVLASLCEEVKEVMEMTGFDHMFQNFDSVEDAIANIK